MCDINQKLIDNYLVIEYNRKIMTKTMILLIQKNRGEYVERVVDFSIDPRVDGFDQLFGALYRFDRCGRKTGRLDPPFAVVFVNS